MASVSNWRSRIVGSDDVAPDELLANPRNWRIHPKAQQDALAGALDQVGWVQRVIVNRQTGHLVDGHLRVELALRRNEPSVPVEYVDLTPEEEGLVLASLDPLAAMAATDEEKLRQLLAEVEFDSKALESALQQLAPESNVQNTDPDDVPAVDEAEVYVKPGDLWLLGDHRLLCGDSTDAADVARVMAGERADVVFTDPPYGVNVKGAKNNSTIAGDLTQTAIPFSFDLAVTVATVDDARLYFCGGEQNLYLYQKLFEKHCRQLPRHLIWVKNGFTMKPNGYHNQYEIIFHGYKSGGGALAHWYGARTEEFASDVWRISRDAVANYEHPTQKPVALPMRAIGNSCPERGLVYEPFSGSGSTIIAAEQLGRRCYAMELEPRYVQVAIERWEKFTGRKAERADG